jgi:hypothetical protein
MARVFETNQVEDTESKFVLNFYFDKKELKKIIKELQDINSNKSDDDYIVLESKEENGSCDKRFEVNLRFERE